MWRSLIVSMALLLICARATPPAAAQPVPGTSWQTELVAVPEFVPTATGFLLAPGVAFIPQAFTETGYDTNPNQTFFDQRGSAFIRSGAGFNLSTVSERIATAFTATGSMLDYFNGTLFDDPLRFAGAVKGNVTYLVQPGMTLSSGAYFSYDGQSFIKAQTGGASVDWGYRDELISSVVHARFSSIEYLDQYGDGALISPLYLTSMFNYNRSEATWTSLLGNNWRVAPYAEVSAARVDYTNQPDPAAVNRSADDYHIKSGVRLIISPEFSSDVGWRLNWRDTDDYRVPSYNSNFFDGSLTWRPSPLFLFAGSIERYIGEPSTEFGILADVRSYTLKATYLPVPGVSVSASGGWQVVNDIGSGLHYNSNFADAQLAWDYNNHVQFYTALHYQRYAFDWQTLEYDGLRVMTGVRIIPDGQDLLQGESLESLLARLEESHVPTNAGLSMSAGYSWFGLPDMKMVTVVGGPLFNQALGQIDDGDGSLNGWRTDLRLSNFASGALPDGNLVSFGLSGFFANYQGITKSHCMYTLTTDCAIANIVDTDPARQNNTGWLGNLNVVADRNVNYYGVAVDFRLGDGGWKDSPGAQYLSPIKFGVAIRGLDEAAKLTSVDPYVSIPAQYKESLNTQYYGVFIGLEQKQSLGEGWIAGLDATAGLYYADTEYQGRYLGYTPSGSGYIQDYGSLNTSLDRSSFIGTLKLTLSRELGWGTAGVFGQGEYLSYVPRIGYNNNDLAAGAPWGIVGTQVGTRIKSDDAFNYTTGLSLSLRAN
jgi:hypothetical protein